MTAPDPTTASSSVPADEPRSLVTKPLASTDGYRKPPPQLSGRDEREWPGRVGFGAAAGKRLGNAPGAHVQGDSQGPPTSPLFLATARQFPSVAADMGVPIDAEMDGDLAARVPHSRRPTVPVSLPAQRGRSQLGGSSIPGPWTMPPGAEKFTPEPKPSRWKRLWQWVWPPISQPAKELTP